MSYKESRRWSTTKGRSALCRLVKMPNQTFCQGQYRRAMQHVWNGAIVSRTSCSYRDAQHSSDPIRLGSPLHFFARVFAVTLPFPLTHYYYYQKNALNSKSATFLNRRGCWNYSWGNTCSLIMRQTLIFVRTTLPLTSPSFIVMMEDCAHPLEHCC